MRAARQLGGDAFPAGFLEHERDERAFEESTAVVDGQFVGLVIDEDNEADLSDDRVARWADTSRSALAGA